MYEHRLTRNDARNLVPDITTKGLVELIQETTPYKTRERNYGAGECRIGTSLEMKKDIYSLGFMSQLTIKEIEPHFEVITGKLKIQHDRLKEEDKDDILYSINRDSKTEKQIKFTQLAN